MTTQGSKGKEKEEDQELWVKAAGANRQWGAEWFTLTGVHQQDQVTLCRRRTAWKSGNMEDRMRRDKWRRRRWWDGQTFSTDVMRICVRCMFSQTVSVVFHPNVSQILPAVEMWSEPVRGSLTRSHGGSCYTLVGLFWSPSAWCSLRCVCQHFSVGSLTCLHGSP